MRPNHENKTNKLMFLQLAEEESVGPISAVHSHRYCAKKNRFLNVHTIPILLIFFVIVIVAAMQLICEG